ncbi:sigma-54-dependent transcriptional regulator [Thermodesulforhabdus norvegica]|uniref:DNA-binding transcriptional response regulator, NtrC family, contains REC, AAA-type ATPase, and a Fis-type DNA-binding domains n=1 Tax=Thermodesulforhabdus norvegica TaxID=39841 RepID=A0A1I4SWR8_9BACT|nr:sigma-54 dependent transcriptional regulator [Thermodesulforhabdus norvegica]SFM68857.1 DNA-binding transcriptional response regulator, NtrC family, contains REC, AAA-type ATPase, and a Fis-type DNA-binding domains [Thermodesulforhabdus norvegica]
MIVRRIAIVDDEQLVCKRLESALSREGHEVETFLSAKSFCQRLSHVDFDVVLLDLRLPDGDGMSILRHIKRQKPHTEVIIITGYGSINNAVEAIKEGAFHYVTKPIRLPEIRHLVRRALERISVQEENIRLKREITTSSSFDGIIGTSRPMQEVFSVIKKVAPLDCNVLIQGASGTGKALVARAIHRLSQRSEKPFVCFNCGGFTEELISSELFGYEKGAFTGAIERKIGLLETADGGTVFLDEIAEMPPSMQVKLLHVLQDKQILRVGGTTPIKLDIRIIAATNKDLKQEVESGRFREDLYYRLNVVSISLPPLSERKEDIPVLVRYMIEKYAKAFGKRVRGVAPEAMSLLLSYDYPGNVRELENIIERAVALADSELITLDDLPPDLSHLELQPLDLRDMITLEEMEKRYIEKVLKKTNYNKSLASRILGLPRTTLWRKIKKYRISL